ncbi:SsgA family sporulation/cell division regulator [Streptomyces sp. NBC_00271]|uniref:SsgA family sporulation/cell division regulator n=1 Tax=Streptomyces sp. NBC_00271 TaxID=2975697 RepID=UPI002E2AB8FB|nr:SsgA family sporulation/cell division regulator [Streptomyces sp. NBC_00271]
MGSRRPRDEDRSSSFRRQPDLYLTLRQRGSPPSTLPVRARFRYDPAFAFAVSVDFATMACTTTWVFSRDLLAEGLLRPSGEGDIWFEPPCPYHRRETLHIGLKGRDGGVLLETDVAPVHDWLAGTSAVVPAGTEGRSIDWDASFEHLHAKREPWRDAPSAAGPAPGAQSTAVRQDHE